MDMVLLVPHMPVKVRLQVSEDWSWHAVRVLSHNWGASTKSAVSLVKQPELLQLQLPITSFAEVAHLQVSFPAAR